MKISEIIMDKYKLRIPPTVYYDLLADVVEAEDEQVDCISRQSVLDKIQRLVNAEQNNIDENGDYMNYARERVNAYEAIQFFVENDCLCPSVTPIRPKGHWIYDKSIANWICSKCGETPKTMGYVGTDAFMAEHFKFCNHCGAEMEGSEEV